MFVPGEAEHLDRESLRVLLAQGESVERIAKRFRRHPSTVSYWMAKHGLEAVGRDKHGPRGGIDRAWLLELTEAGMSIAEIATAVDRSKGTVRHWLRAYGLKTQGGVRASTVGAARAEGQVELEMVCPSHGLTAFVIEGRSYYRCRRCRQEGVAAHRRRLKQTLVREAGGCCRLCGYDRCLAALQFHHLVPADKRAGISARGLTIALESLRAEAAKCVLLCSNCHAEVENGLAMVE
jgi:transposase